MSVLMVRHLIVITIVLMESGIHLDLVFSQHSTDFKNNSILVKNFFTETVTTDKKYNTSFTKNFSTRDEKVKSDKQLDTAQTDYYSVIPGFRYLELKGAPGKKILVNKCCPLNFYFDTESLRCLKFSDDILGLPSSRNFTYHIENVDNETKYVFIEKVPDCEEGYVLSIQTKTKVNINPNGIVIDGKLFSNYCVQEKYSFPNESLVLTCVDAKKFCKKKSCFRKCCPLRKSYRSDRTCHKLDDPFTPQIYDLNTLTLINSTSISEFGIILGDACGSVGKYLIGEDEYEESYFGSNGYLYVPSYQKIYSKNEFCLESFQFHNDFTDTGSFICFEDDEMQFLLITIALSISSFSLLITFMVYLFLPKFQNCYGKSLMCYVACLFSAYLSLAIANYSLDLPRNICNKIAYTILFFFLAAFSWLNVMSFDIWKTFSSDRSVDKSQLHEEKNKFFYYSLYAWIFPCVITTWCAVVNEWEDFPYPIVHPQLGEGFCWFMKGSIGFYLYFVTPFSLIMISNIIFYLLTAVKICKVKSEVRKMEKRKKKKFIANKDQFKINIKLFIVMGISWSLEIISGFVRHPIWYIGDALNALHGVFIFAIFLLKKEARVYKYNVFVIVLIQEKMRNQLKKIRNISSTKRTIDSENKNVEKKERTKKEERSFSSEETS